MPKRKNRWPVWYYDANPFYVTSVIYSRLLTVVISGAVLIASSASLIFFTLSGLYDVTYFLLVVLSGLVAGGLAGLLGYIAIFAAVVIDQTMKKTMSPVLLYSVAFSFLLFVPIYGCLSSAEFVISNIFQISTGIVLSAIVVHCSILTNSVLCQVLSRLLVSRGPPMYYTARTRTKQFGPTGKGQFGILQLLLFTAVLSPFFACGFPGLIVLYWLITQVATIFLTNYLMGLKLPKKREFK